MKTFQFNQEQITEILAQFAREQGGINEILKVAFEAIMKAERNEHNLLNQDLSNGYRIRRTFGKGRLLELNIPRTRMGNFYPVLLGMLKNQEEECRQMAFKLYGAGLTTEQVGEIFDEIYGREYSKSSISRMFDYAREEVIAWINRPLESYYPMIFIDATFISVRRADSVSKEAFYTVLAVKEDQTREVIGLFNFPVESAVGWQQALMELKHRGVNKIGLLVSDGLSGLEDAVSSVYPGADHQLCVVHLMRSMRSKVRTADKPLIDQQLKDIFRTGDRSYDFNEALEAWNSFCFQWAKKYPSIGKMANNPRYQLYFTYLSYHEKIQSMIYTTNWIERLNRDYKRVIRMRGALPDPDSVLLLLGRVAMTRKAYYRKIPKINLEQKKFRWLD